MSVQEFFADVLHGNFSHAISRLEDYWETELQPELKQLVTKFTSEAGNIVWEAGTKALEDVVAGKSISQAANDVWEEIKDKVPDMAISDLEDAIGIQKRAK